MKESLYVTSIKNVTILDMLFYKKAPYFDMTDTNTTIIMVISIILILSGVFAMYAPSFLLSKSEQLRGKEFGKKYPKMRWMRWGFILLYLPWSLFVLFGLPKFISWTGSFMFLGGLFAFIGLFFGLFAYATDVFVLPTKTLWPLHFVVGIDARKMGQFQIIWSLSIIFLSVIFRIVLTAFHLYNTF